MVSCDVVDQAVGKRVSRYRGVFSQPGSVRWVALARDGDQGQALYLGSHDNEVSMSVFSCMEMTNCLEMIVM